MLTWAPRVPSRNSRLTNSGSPSRAEAGRQPVGHPVEEQRLVALLALGPADLAAGQRRHEHLGLEPGGQHLRRLGHLGGQDAVLDEEHVGVEAGPLVAGPDLRHHARQRQRRAVGQRPVAHDDVVELQAQPGASATQNSSGVASSVPSTRPTPTGDAPPFMSMAPSRRQGTPGV